MQLSPRTLEVLRNFSTINTTLPFQSGSVIRVLSSATTTMGEAVVEEVFPRDFAIYDMNQFLALLNMSKTPTLDLEDSYAVINGEVKYWYADPRLKGAKAAPSIKLATEDVAFDLSSAILDRVNKASSIMSLPELSFSSKDGDIVLTGRDIKNVTSNNIEVSVGDKEHPVNHVFNIDLNVENMKLLKRDYRVTLNSNRIVRFESKGEPDGLSLTYYVASLKSSNFGD